MRYCRKCGARTGMIVEEVATGKVLSEIDLCYDCLWEGFSFTPITEQITIQEAEKITDWGAKMKEVNDRLLY